MGGKTLDYKDFHDGLLSLAMILNIFSFSFMLSSILLKSYINLSVKDRDFIVILCSINLLFSFYYIGEISRLEKIFKLENKNIIKFGKRIGVITLFYIPLLFLLITLLFRDTHNLERIMIFLIILIELLIIGVVFKEVYDLVFLEQTRRDFEIEENRKKYIDKEIRTSLKE
ncbi:MAG: hypothetical protein ACFFFT_01980 [Candidatus Thorarchaeota archaeon]